MNGQRSVNPFLRLSSLTMHRISAYIEGAGDPPPVSDEVKKQIADEAVAAFKASLPKAPDKYEVKLPEGSLLASTVLDRVSPLAKELGLTSNEHVQKMVDLLNGEAKALADKIAADHSPGGTVFERTRREHQNAALQAPDLGNGSTETLQAKVARVTAFTAKHFPDDVRKLLDDSGIGNDPRFLRAMIKLADLSREDGLTGGKVGGSKKSFAERIYGKETTT